MIKRNWLIFFYRVAEWEKNKFVQCLFLDDRIDRDVRTRGWINACENKHLYIIQLLSAYGVNVDYVHDDGDTLLHKAAISSIDIFDLTLQQYDNQEKVLSALDYDNKTPFYIGCVRGLFQDKNNYFFQRMYDSDQRKTIFL